MDPWAQLNDSRLRARRRRLEKIRLGVPQARGEDPQDASLVQRDNEVGSMSLQFASPVSCGSANSSQSGWWSQVDSPSSISSTDTFLYSKHIMKKETIMADTPGDNQSVPIQIVRKSPVQTKRPHRSKTAQEPTFTCEIRTGAKGKGKRRQQQHVESIQNVQSDPQGKGGEEERTFVAKSVEELDVDGANNVVKNECEEECEEEFNIALAPVESKKEENRCTTIFQGRIPSAVQTIAARMELGLMTPMSDKELSFVYSGAKRYAKTEKACIIAKRESLDQYII